AVAVVRSTRVVAEIERRRHPFESDVEPAVAERRVVALIAVADVKGVGVEQIGVGLTVQPETGIDAIAKVAVALVARLVAVDAAEEASDVERARERARRPGRGGGRCGLRRRRWLRRQRRLVHLRLRRR